MKSISLFVFSILWSYSTQAFNYVLDLKKNEGRYELVAEESDYYCFKASQLYLRVSGTQVTIQVSEPETTPQTEVIAGINTSHYTEAQYLGAIVYTRYVFKNGQLKAQEKTLPFLPIPSKYKDSRTILSILGNGKIEYNYSSFGDTMCRYIRVSIL